MKQTPKQRKPGRPKAVDSAETMQHILRVAAFQFMDQGFEKVSLSGVAKACGVTKASVYYYYTNKSELFTAALLFVLQMAYKQSAIIIQTDAPLRERMHLLASKQMRNAHIEFESMMREASPALSEEQVRQIRDSEGAIHTLLENMFQQAIDSGEIIPCDPLLLAHSFAALLNVRNRKELINEHNTIENTASDIINIIMNGILPRKADG